MLQKVKETLASIRQSLQKEPKTMEDLKSVLRAIALIRDSAMVKEIAFTDLEERFRQVFLLYDVFLQLPEVCSMPQINCTPTACIQCTINHMQNPLDDRCTRSSDRHHGCCQLEDDH